MNNLINNILKIIVEDNQSLAGCILSCSSEQGNKLLFSYQTNEHKIDIENFMCNLQLTKLNSFPEGMSHPIGMASPKGTPSEDTHKKDNDYLFNYRDKNDVMHSVKLTHITKLFSDEKNNEYYFILLSEKNEKLNKNINNYLSSISKILIELIKNQNEIYSSSSNYENYFNLLTETTSDLILLLNKEGKIEFINTNGALNLNYLTEEIKGKYFLDFLSAHYKDEIINVMQKLLLSNEIIPFEVKLKSKLGENILFDFKAKSYFVNEQLDCILIYGKNIDKEIQYKQEIEISNKEIIELNHILEAVRDNAKEKISILEELNRLKNEFVSNISHELRTPLASIIGFSETIDSDPDMPENLKKEFNQIILQEAKRLAKLINDILDISKIENGNISLEKSRFEINKLLKDVVHSFNHKAESKQIILSSNISEDETYVFADKEKIEKAISHLIDNAIKFTNKNGRVSILSRTFSKEFEIIISDTGIGFPKEDLPFIFQKFYKFNNKNYEINGSGLGLAFVKQIIDLHKGLLTVQSEKDKGTTFIIKLSLLNN
ncbi:MAG: hypothetical protein STSR0008_02930 [Ignavibacterium sp.]